MTDPYGHEGGRLDPALDPDRYDPGRDDPGRDDPGRDDPGRDDLGRDGPGRTDRTLPELLDGGGQEEARDSWTWLLGLVSVLAFLALVVLVSRVLGP